MFKKLSSPDFSIGIDLEEVARFRKLKRVAHRRFLERVFTPRELKYCFSKKDPAPHLAARFCAKEAVVKALAGIGIYKVPYRDVSVVNNVKGVPKARLHMSGKALKVSVSLSHTADFAIAFAIVYYA